MQFMKIFAGLVIATLASPGIRACAQAHVTENQTTYIYVDGQVGSDSSAGTQSTPLRTIQAAINKASANNIKSIGTKVLINPGVYRESLSIQSNYSQTGATMTFQAAQTGTAVIAGSNILTNWYQNASNPAIYDSYWQYNFGNCATPYGWPADFAPIVLRSEMVFVNGIPLTQVMSFSDMRAGTFYVSEASSQIHVWPGPSVTNIKSAVVEAAVRPQTLSMNGRSNVVFRGLVFKHAANCINTAGASVNNSSNVLFDQVQAVWNNWGGLGINSSSQITVQNSVGSHNGGVGFSGTTNRNVLYNYNETDYNNWRGAMGALYDWGMGGLKLMLTHGGTVTNHYSYRNQAQGLWFDTDNKNITITNARLAENVLTNLQLEASEGPVSMTNSNLCSGGAGATVLNTDHLTLKNNTFYNNGGTNKWQGELFLGGASGGKLVSDWETGLWYIVYTSNTTMSGNTFQDAASGQYVFATYLSGSDWSGFASSLSSNLNHWYDPATTTAFKVPNGKIVNLAGWQGQTGEDLASNWAASSSAASACAVPYPSFTDFSVNADSHNYQMGSAGAVITLRVNSFGYGTVTLKAAGLPAGVSASFSHASLTSGVSVLTLTASASALYQTVPITVFANSGSRVHAVTLMVSVAPGTGGGGGGGGGPCYLCY
jgi:hypothetical protein